MDDWLRYGFIPSPWAVIAAKAEYEEFKPADLTEEERNEFADLRDWVITQILDPAPKLEQVRGAAEGVTPQWPLPKGTMPREDRDDIWLVARRIYRPRARQIDVAELGPVAALLPFLDGTNSADVPADVPSPRNGSRSRSRDS